MITAATITDAQIRDLARELKNKTPNLSISDRMLLLDCRIALLDTSIGYCTPEVRRHYERSRSDARARCAEILNARAASKVVK